MEKENIIAVRANKTVYKDGDEAVKFFNSEHPGSNVLNEALNLVRIEECGLRVPELVEVKKIEGQWALVTKYIAGKTMGEMMDEKPEKLQEYMSKFVDIQIDMQSHQVPMLSRLKEKMHRKIDQCGLDATARYELQARLDRIKENHKLCHGDYNPTNVIITDVGEVYILDWAHATQGNASGDAARTYLLFQLAGQPERAEMYLQMFCDKTDTAKQYVQSWMSIVAASQLVKDKPEQREFLMRWINIFDY